jgi:hypothetical protein
MNDRQKDLILIFLVALYPFLHFLQTNSTIILINDFYTCFVVFILCFMFLSLSYLVLSTLLGFIKIKDSVVVIFICLFSILFFDFHEIKIFLRNYMEIKKEIFIMSFMKNYPILPVMLVFFFASFFIFYFHKKIRKFLFSVFMVLDSFFLLLLLFGSISSISFYTHPFVSDAISLNSVEWKQNVYVIVVDGYPRHDFAKKYLDYDNTAFLDFLRSKGFYLVEKSTSNYPITFLSLHSFLTSSYPYIENTPSYDRTVAYKFLGGLNPVTEAFSKKGYTYIHIGSGAWDGSRCQNSQAKYYTRPLPFNLSYETLNIFLNKTPLAGKINLSNDIVVTIADIEKFLETKLKKDEKIFLFAHTLPPHAPFIFDADCKKKFCFAGTDLGATQDSKKDFLENILCVNKQIKSLVHFLEKNDPNALIVFLSDHGSDFSVDWLAFPENWSKEAVDERFSNFLAIKAPAEYQKKYLYPSLSCKRF